MSITRVDLTITSQSRHKLVVSHRWLRRWSHPKHQQLDNSITKTTGETRAVGILYDYEHHSLWLRRCLISPFTTDAWEMRSGGNKRHQASLCVHSLLWFRSKWKKEKLGVFLKITCKTCEKKATGAKFKILISNGEQILKMSSFITGIRSSCRVAMNFNETAAVSMSACECALNAENNIRVNGAGRCIKDSRWIYSIIRAPITFSTTNIYSEKSDR